jgi:hypothetical protein
MNGNVTCKVAVINRDVAAGLPCFGRFLQAIHLFDGLDGLHNRTAIALSRA